MKSDVQLLELAADKMVPEMIFEHHDVIDSDRSGHEH
jgi:hypothetical protein